jgi:hypothetical protein
VARYIGHRRKRHGAAGQGRARLRGTARLAKAALASAVPPLMLKTDDNPGRAPIEVPTRCEMARSRNALDLSRAPTRD